jgi:TATA-box binding protein (TBP) (component of TFIID and TFIIIB)
MSTKLSATKSTTTATKSSKTAATATPIKSLSAHTLLLAPAFTKTDLRISTMVITAHWGTQIDLDKLFESLKAVIIPIWYPDIGILKFENKNMVLGASHKDIFTNRKITSKSFFNQSTLVLRRKINEGTPEEGWKEVNVKLFANGGIQMTGVTSEEFAYKTIVWLLDTIKTLPVSPFAEAASIDRFSVQLINTDYALNKFINQDALHKILINDYNLFSMLEKTIYQGVNTKFFYNTRNPARGICECEKGCKGQGTGDGDGECKRITMSIFRTGRIIITGARQLNQIRAAYDFLNTVFEKHHRAVLYEPTAPVPASITTTTILSATA